ncbi:MAG: LytTR family transcriptional regulator [Bacteroidales bacterium]|nr:LytTR family transcriptional regulator [Bacteroidales bacterium]
MKKYLILQNSKRLLRLATDDIMYISSEGYYSEIHLANGTSFQWTSTTASIINTLVKHSHFCDNFFRLGRSHLINLNYLSYIDLETKSLKLLNRNMDITVLNASRNSLKLLKDYVGHNTVNEMQGNDPSNTLPEQ